MNAPLPLACLQPSPTPAHTPDHAPDTADLLIATLLAHGIDTVFGYPGGAVLPLYDALHREPRLRHVLVRHEQAAVHAAQGYARSTGRIGVVFVTSGPGMSNTTTGLLDALCDSVPVLCISGQVATTSIGTDAFQECDALGISRPVTKWNARVRSAAQLVPLLRKALAVAAGGRPGPVLLDLPKDVQLAPQVPVHANGWAPEPRPARPNASLRRAVDALREARRPVFYGGGGLINAGPAACAAFAELVRRWQEPIRRLCVRMTGDAHRGEDLAQEAFARVFAKRQDFEPGRKFST